MELDPDRCYDAFIAHDTRFDGRVFIGVRSTGIYCRPVCRVRAPRRKVCEFFVSAAAAEAAGFRPCLRCRPELAPGLSAMDASATLAHAAAGLIDTQPDARFSVASLAARVGVTERHLRRLFRQHFGVAPADYLRTRRLLLAKHLLTDTTLPVTEVAHAAGFGSLRALEAAFVRRYRLQPSALRKNRPGRAATDDALSFTLAWRPPFDLDRLRNFLAARTLAGVEDVSEGDYRRSVRVGDRTGWLQVRGGKTAMAVRMSPSLAPVVPEVLARVRRLFDLDADPQAVTQALGALAAPRPGLRLPGAFDGIEMAVRAVLGQQITVKAARTLAGRFVHAFGTPIDTPWPEVDAVFPSATEIAALPPARIAELGIISRRAEVIVALADAVAAGRLVLAPGAEVQATLNQLQALPGIGPWTAHYIAMRALAWPDAFPDGDYGIRAALGHCTARAAREQAEAWRPWRAYAVMHLWASLAEAGESTP